MGKGLAGDPPDGARREPVSVSFSFTGVDWEIGAGVLSGAVCVSGVVFGDADMPIFPAKAKGGSQLKRVGSLGGMRLTYCVPYGAFKVKSIGSCNIIVRCVVDEG